MSIVISADHRPYGFLRLRGRGAKGGRARARARGELLSTGGKVQGRFREGSGKVQRRVLAASS
jgi:hypothetical protein